MGAPYLLKFQLTGRLVASPTSHHPPSSCRHPIIVTILVAIDDPVVCRRKKLAVLVH